jgi:hypothetical protein
VRCERTGRPLLSGAPPARGGRRSIDEHERASPFVKAAVTCCCNKPPQSLAISRTIRVTACLLAGRPSRTSYLVGLPRLGIARAKLVAEFVKVSQKAFAACVADVMYRDCGQEVLARCRPFDAQASEADRRG